MAKKKGDVSVSFLVTLSLAIIVLIIIGLFFMGKTEWLFERQEQATETVLSDATKNLAIQKCKIFCSLDNRDSYNNPGFSQEVRDAGFVRCSDFEDLDEYDAECMKCAGSARDSCSGKAQDACSGDCTWDDTAKACKRSALFKDCSELSSKDECLKVLGCNWA